MEPVFLSFSVTSHNDIFYVLFGILTLYFSINKSKVLSLLVAPIFFVISCLTSEWMFVLLGPILLLVYSLKIVKLGINNLLKSSGLIALFVSYLSIFLLPQVWDIYYTGTRFNPIDKFKLFFNIDNISYVLSRVFNLTDNQVLNSIILYSFIVGSFLIVLGLLKPKLILAEKICSYSQPSFFSTFDW